MQIPRVTILFLLLLFFARHVDAQNFLIDVDFNRIEQEKVQEFVVYQQEHGIETFNEIKPSLHPDANLKGYFIRENVYQVKKSLKEVWHHYLTTKPEKLWSGKKVSFGFLFSKKDEKIYYCNESFSKIDTGVIVYINLRLMSGLKNIATAFELTAIDEENKIIELSYVKGNVSVGKQRIQFYETPKGYTQILHTSYYMNNNALRNYLLYPYFHTRTTHEFHRNNKRQILAGN